MKPILTVVTLVLLGSLSLGAAPKAKAQADQGKALFQKKMCAACHAPGKKGGDLKDSKMNKAAMIKFMKNPKAVNPKAAMMAVKATDAELGSLADYMLSLKK